MVENWPRPSGFAIVVIIIIRCLPEESYSSAVGDEGCSRTDPGVPSVGLDSCPGD